jgi:hypothetical protein
MSKNDQILTESILDPVRKTRCKVLFDENEKLRPEVKNFIMNVITDWQKQIHGDDFKMSTVYILGSSAGFQYTDSSDVDIHIETDIVNNETWHKYSSLLPKALIYPGSKMPFEFNLETGPKGPLPFNYKDADDVYDILADKWLKKSEQSDVEVPYAYVMEISKFFLNAFDLQISQLERDIHEYNTYHSMAIDDMAGFTEKEKDDAISKAISALRIDIDAIKVGVHVMKAFRHEAFDHSGEPLNISIDISSNGQYAQRSINNMVYKTFEGFGYHDKEKEEISKAKAVIDEYENEHKQAEGKLAKAAEAVAKTMTKKDDWKDSVDDQKKDSVKESDDLDIGEVLVENGYENTEHNIDIVKRGLNSVYYIESLDEDDGLFEDFKSRTEHRLHKTLYKVSGKWTNILPEIIGILLAGVPGLFISTMLHIEHNVRMDSVQQDLYAEVKDDDECNSIINDIKGELNKPKPDKKAVKAMRERFKNRLFALKNKIKAERIQMDDSGKAKFLESCTDGDIKALLLKEGYAQTDHNVTILKYDRSRLEKLYESAQVHEDSNGKPYTMDGSKRDYAYASAKEEPSDETAGKPSAK